MKNNILIVLLVVIAVLFFQRECSRPEPVTLLVPHFIYDTTIVENTIKPEPIITIVPGDTVYISDTVYVTSDDVPPYIWEVISEHYSRKFYEEVLINDSSAYLRIGVELFKNNVEDLNYSFINRRPIDVICPECPTIRNKWFIGGTISGSPTQFGAGPSAALLTRRDNLYSYNYDIINGVHSVSMFYKLSFR